MGKELNEQMLPEERERERGGEERRGERFEWLVSLVVLDLWAVLRVEVDTERCPEMFPNVSKIRK